MGTGVLHVHEEISCVCPLGGNLQTREALCHNARAICLAVAALVMSEFNPQWLLHPTSPVLSVPLIQQLFKLLLSKQLRKAFLSVRMNFFLYSYPRGFAHLCP